MGIFAIFCLVVSYLENVEFKVIFIFISLSRIKKKDCSVHYANIFDKIIGFRDYLSKASHLIEYEVILFYWIEVRPVTG